jgi:hypothetical protein
MSATNTGNQRRIENGKTKKVRMFRSIAVLLFPCVASAAYATPGIPVKVENTTADLVVVNVTNQALPVNVTNQTVPVNLANQTVPVNVTNLSSEPIPITGTLKVGQPFRLGWRSLMTPARCTNFSKALPEVNTSVLESLFVEVTAKATDIISVGIYSPGWMGSPDVELVYTATAVPGTPGKFIVDKLVNIPAAKKLDVSVCRKDPAPLGAPMTSLTFITGTQIDALLKIW